MRTPSRDLRNEPPLDYVCRLAPLSLWGQSESRPDPEAGPKGILILAYRNIKTGLVLKLLMRAFSWHPWTPGTLKLD